MPLNLNRATLSSEPINVVINDAVELASLVKHASDQPRGYLGASLIGDECARKIQFEWMTGASFSARVRSIFARGHFFEAESRQQLIDAGFMFAPTEALGFIAAGGLMAGHADGVIVGVPRGICLTTPSVWESKGLNAKNFRVVERDGLAKVFPKYAAQVALYQAFLNVTNPALVTIVNADTCERLHFTFAFDARLAQEASDRAVGIIAATRAGELLPRLDPTLGDWPTEPGVNAMPKKLDAIMSKVAPLIRLLGSPTEHEALAAVRALRRLLATAGLDIHALADLVEHGDNEPLSAGEMQKIYDAAYQKGYGDGSERGRRSAVLAAAPIPTSPANVADGVNGYSWQDIAQYCARNPHRLANDWEREFVESVAEKLTYHYDAPTPKMASSLRRIFLNRFAGKIE